jgi:thiol-disulfide isomerase/thioredoxin
MTQLESELAALAVSKGYVVLLGYQSYCDVCNATKPHLEALAEEYDFALQAMNMDSSIAWTQAGKTIPAVRVYYDGRPISEPLLGTKTRSQLLQFLIDSGVIQL